MKNTNLIRETAVVLFLSLVCFTAYSVSMVFTVDAVSKTFLPLLAVERLDLNYLIANHWSTRWGYTVPQALFHILLPGRIEAVFVFPILAAAAAIATLFYSLSVHTNFSLYLKISTVLVLGFNTALLGTMITDQESAPAFLYLFLAIHFALSLEKYGKSSSAFLTSFFLFLTFTCNAIFLAFVAGVAIFFGLRRKFKVAATVLGFFVFLGLLDTLFFWIASHGEITFGRLDQFLKTIEHTQTIDNQRMNSYLLTEIPNQASTYTGFLPALSYNLSRWHILPKINLIVFLLFFLSLLFSGLAGKKLNPKNKASYQIHAVMALGFFLLVSASISSIQPVRPLIDLTSRYSVLFFPLALIVVITTINWLLSNQRLKVIIEKTSLAILILGLGFIWSPFAPNCTVDNDQQPSLYGKTFCSLFRQTNGPHLLPRPPFFFFAKSHNFYRQVYSDYLSGRLSLTPPFVLPNLALFYIVDKEFPRGGFYTLAGGGHRYYSRTGESTSACLREPFGQGEPRQSYFNCQDFDETVGEIRPGGFHLLPVGVSRFLTGYQ